MRMTILVIVGAVGLSLISHAQTNQREAQADAVLKSDKWEAQADAVLKSDKSAAAKLYATALSADGATASSQLSTGVQQESALSAVDRVLAKIPWQGLSRTEFKTLFLSLQPTLKGKFVDKARLATRKELVNRYRLLRDTGDEKDTIADVTLVTNVISADVTLVTNVISLDTLASDTVDLSESVAAWDTAFAITGGRALPVPVRNSVLGMRYKALRSRIDEAGTAWLADAELVADWEAYWGQVKVAVDRRTRAKAIRSR